MMKKSFNPPPPKHLVQGDQSPTNYSHSSGGSIPQNIVQKVEICLKKEINPPPTMTLVQGDQSPTYYDSSPGGSIPQNIV